jgi:hypothetical protein
MSILVQRAARRAARSVVSRPEVVRRPRRVMIALVLAASAAALASTSAVAHGELFFQLGAERVQPGGTVEIRADLGAGEAFDVTLISKADGGRRFIATLPAAEEGHLQSFLTIPANVPAGDYLVEVAFDLTVLRTSLTVAGSPVGEDGQQPGQDDGLNPRVPLSSALPEPEPASSLQARASGPAVTGARSPTDAIAVAAVAAGIAIGLVMVLRFTARRRHVPPADGSSSVTG